MCVLERLLSLFTLFSAESSERMLHDLGGRKEGRSRKKNGERSVIFRIQVEKMKLDFGSIQESDLSILEKDFPDFQRDEEEKENFL